MGQADPLGAFGQGPHLQAEHAKEACAWFRFPNGSPCRSAEADSRAILLAWEPHDEEKWLTRQDATYQSRPSTYLAHRQRSVIRRSINGNHLITFQNHHFCNFCERCCVHVRCSLLIHTP